MKKFFKLCGELEKVEHTKKLNDIIVEKKIDGTRNLFFFKKGKLKKIFNRRGLNTLYKYPQLLSLKLKEKYDYVFDGEIAFFNSEGVSKLNLSQKKVNWNNCVAVLFDVLVYESLDVRNKSLIERKGLLKSVEQDFLNGNKHFLLVQHYSTINEGWEAVEEKGLEGLIIKKKESNYDCVRNNDWLKLKNWKFRTVRFNDFEVHNKGITLTNSKHRVACNGKQSVGVAERIVIKGFVDVYVRFLEETVNGFLRKPTFHGIKRGVKK